ncbi:MAG: trypsin-like peptidase domain-containing protein [Micrococcales bacterium]|nr:trypsin-like peptidase domain-containing protein [Micrococcales bacterium]
MPDSADTSSTPEGAVEEATTARRAVSSRPVQLGIMLAAAALFGGIVGTGVMHLATSGPAGSCQSMLVTEQALPSVVTVLASKGEASGNGTGQLIRSGGYVLTNDHVVSMAANGGTVRVQYADGTMADAPIIGRDPAMDLAVLKAQDGAVDRPLIRTGSSGDLRVGQPVVALGAPLGLSSTVTAGIISGLGRYVPVPTEGQTAHLIDAIQTDAAINPGNSGGALVDCDGALVGVNSAIATVPNSEGVGGGGSVGLGFAIPVDLALPIAGQLIDTGRAGHPDLGFSAQALLVPGADGSVVPPGLYVTDVRAGGPGQKAGLLARDVIVTIAGEPARSVEQLVLQTLTRQAGDSVKLTVWRSGQTREVVVVLGEAPLGGR